MIIEKFTEWKATRLEEDEFALFADKFIGIRTMHEVLKDLMYQVYMSQCCIEGLLEDIEFSSVNKETPSSLKNIKDIGDRV